MVGLERFVAYPSALAAISARAQGVGMGHWTISVTTRVGSFLIDTASHQFEIPIDYPETRHLTESPKPATGELRRTGPRLERSS